MGKLTLEQEDRNAKQELAIQSCMKLKDLEITDVPHAMLLLRVLGEGSIGIPTDFLVISAMRLGRYPNSLRERIQFWKALDRLLLDEYVTTTGTGCNRTWHSTPRGWNVVLGGGYKKSRYNNLIKAG